MSTSTRHADPEYLENELREHQRRFRKMCDTVRDLHSSMDRFARDVVRDDLLVTIYEPHA